MNQNKLHNILDLIEEIVQVDKMIVLHQDSNSALMLNQYKNQKLKLSNFLFNQLLANSDSKSEIMYIIKLFIEKFYSKELSQLNLVNDDNLKTIERVFLEN